MLKLEKFISAFSLESKSNSILASEVKLNHKRNVKDPLTRELAESYWGLKYCAATSTGTEYHDALINEINKDIYQQFISEVNERFSKLPQPTNPSSQKEREKLRDLHGRQKVWGISSLRWKDQLKNLTNALTLYFNGTSQFTLAQIQTFIEKASKTLIDSYGEDIGSSLHYYCLILFFQNQVFHNIQKNSIRWQQTVENAGILGSIKRFLSGSSLGIASVSSDEASLENLKKMLPDSQQFKLNEAIFAGAINGILQYLLKNATPSNKQQLKELCNFLLDDLKANSLFKQQTKLLEQFSEIFNAYLEVRFEENLQNRDTKLENLRVTINNCSKGQNSNYISLVLALLNDLKQERFPGNEGLQKTIDTIETNFIQDIDSKSTFAFGSLFYSDTIRNIQKPRSRQQEGNNREEHKLLKEFYSSHKIDDQNNPNQQEQPLSVSFADFVATTKDENTLLYDPKIISPRRYLNDYPIFSKLIQFYNNAILELDKNTKIPTQLKQGEKENLEKRRKTMTDIQETINGRMLEIISAELNSKAENDRGMELSQKSLSDLSCLFIGHLYTYGKQEHKDKLFKLLNRENIPAISNNILPIKLEEKSVIVNGVTYHFPIVEKLDRNPSEKIDENVSLEATFVNYIKKLDENKDEDIAAKRAATNSKGSPKADSEVKEKDKEQKENAVAKVLKEKNGGIISK